MEWKINHPVRLPSLNIDSVDTWHFCRALTQILFCLRPPTPPSNTLSAMRWEIPIGVLGHQPSAPSHFALGQRCRYQYSPTAVYAVDGAKAGTAWWWMSHRKEGDWYRHIMHSVCQLVRCAVCARALISSVWLTRPACPSISGFVTLSVWLWLYPVPSFFVCIF